MLLILFALLCYARDGVINSPSQEMHDLAGFAVQGLINGFQAGQEDVTGILDTISQKVLQWGQDLIPSLQQKLAPITSVFQQAFAGAPGAIQAALDGISAQLILAADPANDKGVLGLWGTTPKSLFSKMLGKLGGGGEANPGNGGSFIPNAREAFVYLMQTAIPEALESGMPSIVDYWRNELQQMIDAARDAAAQITDIMKGIPTAPGGGNTTTTTTTSTSVNGPHLADGGIVTGPTPALIGEGKSPEAVIPLDQLPGILGTVAAPAASVTINLGGITIQVLTPLGPEFKAASGVAWDPYMRGLAYSLKRLLAPRPGNALGVL